MDFAIKFRDCDDKFRSAIIDLFRYLIECERRVGCGGDGTKGDDCKERNGEAD